jgi:D-threo-aldose 1-dehydrogenase
MTPPVVRARAKQHRIGRFLYRQPRGEIILSTKVGRVLRAPRRPAEFDTGFWTGGLHFEHRFDYSYDGVMRAYEDRLQRLGMNRIDLLVIHDLDWWHHGRDAMVAAKLLELANGGWRALMELKADGRINAIGAGINELGMIPRFLDLLDLDFLLALRTLGEQERCKWRSRSASRAGQPRHRRRLRSGLYATGPVPGAKYNYADPAPGCSRGRGGSRRLRAPSRRSPRPRCNSRSPSCGGVGDPGAFRPSTSRRTSIWRAWRSGRLWSELKHEGLISADAPTPTG